MNIIRMEESIEPCTESGWYAYDLLLERPMEEAQICALAQLGSLTYLRQLHQPFYKLNQNYFYIQGMQGEAQLRLAVYKEEEEQVLRQFQKWLESLDCEQ